MEYLAFLISVVLFYIWFKKKSTAASKPVQSDPSSVAPVEELNDGDYEQCLMELLEEVGQGQSWGQLQGFLISRGISNEKLAQWLIQQQESWQAEPEKHLELAKGLEKLGKVATGELAEIAKVIAIMFGDEQCSLARERKILSAATNESFRTAEDWLNEGQTLSKQRCYEEALVSYDQALTINPKYDYAWYCRGRALFDLGRYEEVLTNYEQALKINPKYYVDLNCRGGAFFQLGNYEEALADFERLCTYESKNQLGWSNRASALTKLKRYDEALTISEQALKLDQYDVATWNTRSVALSKLEHYKEAFASFEKALEINPYHVLTWSNRGVALYDLEHYEEAIANFDQALRINSKDANSWYFRGNSLRGLGHYEEAIASFEQALKLEPYDILVWSNRGHALHDLRHYEEAIASFEQALKTNPNDGSAWVGRGNALGSLGHNEEAIASFEQALKLEPNNYHCWRNRGIAAADSQGHAPSYQQQFLRRFQFSLNHSQNILSATFKSDSLELDVDQRLSLLSAIRQPLSAATAAQIHQDSLEHPSLSNPALNQRGYEGELASLRAELDRAIQRDADPKGWGKLHYYIGRTHVDHARTVEAPLSFWRKAKANFETSLQTLIVENGSVEEHLDALQSLIQVLSALGETAKAQALQQDGSDLCRRLSEDPEYPPIKLRSLRSRATKFNQITVDLAVQAGEVIDAIELAEQGKSTFLRWLLGDAGQELSSNAYSALRGLLTPKTAILYWHISPSAITTFILLPDGEQPLILPPQLDLPVSYAPTLTTSEPDHRPTTLKQLMAWEKWLNEWNRDYESYSSKKGNLENHSWRQQLSARLAALGKILNVDAIKEMLATHTLTALILMPHRDLHRFPLQYFFEIPCTYLPSVHLHSQFKPNSAGYFDRLLLVENPKNEQIPDQNEIFMELESELVQSFFDNPAAHHIVPRNDANVNNVKNALQQPHTIFHFTGHAAYNSRNPVQSSLYLSGKDQFTLRDIAQLDLSAYQLVCLAACETAVTGKQTITDEYVGLVSAFLKAKATRVVSTFWQVESAASALFIFEFYESLRETNSPAIALQQAQTNLKALTRDKLSQKFDTWLETPQVLHLFRAILQAERERIQSLTIEHPYDDPFYWSAFSLSGQ